ncbi:CocE/NonD family hydrolase [Streptomyces jumonjinensis]|uniref:CocE/NonD family hydrolase n=1 Tax=Streptomyces jumonjinensis TaxID=1945 RepID=UPI0037B8BFDE
MTYRVTVGTPVPVRDGTQLATDIWRPETDTPVPALLVRNPYGKHQLANYGFTSPNIFRLVEAGYVVVLQECRGTFGSEGHYTPHVHEGADGADTVAWLARQEWCDGTVGTWGVSYLGMTQWQTAATGVPGLKAIAPSIASADLYRAPYYSPGGALSLDTVLMFATIMSANDALRDLAGGTGDPAEPAAIGSAFDDLTAQASITPPTAHPALAARIPWIFGQAMGHPGRDETWRELSALDKAGSITVPALNIGGWYDPFAGETLRAYTEMKRCGGSPEARTGQRLIMGPWTHSSTTGVFPDRSFGFTASADAADMTGAHLAFFDRWLRGRDDPLDRPAPVRIFVMGTDRWRDEEDWPLPDTRYTPYHLDGPGPANTSSGTGTLTVKAPEDDYTDTYLYDPRRPVPTLGGSLMRPTGSAGPVDQRPVESRDDVLCFTSATLNTPVEVTGPVSATLFVSSSAPDTDFTVKLVDVHPDGRAINLCDGIQRMRYRDSLDTPEPMEPGTVYEITVDLIATANVFLPGHRILVEISSSNFPRYDRNSNTGGIIATEHDTQMSTAVNRIHRGPGHPSRITLPVITRETPVR